MDFYGLVQMAIDLAALYWILSTACSFIIEAANSLRNLRGQGLVRFIGEMTGGGMGLSQEVLRHPLIQALYRPNRGAKVAIKQVAPSYVPAETFAHVLVDVVLKQSMHAGPPTFNALRSAIAGSHLSSQLQSALLPLVDAANYDLAAARKNIERWYDAVMERAGGWYKRHCTLLLFGLGLLIAAGFNINSLRIARELLLDPQLRAQGARLGAAIHEQPTTAVIWVQQGAFVAALEKFYDNWLDEKGDWTTAGLAERSAFARQAQQLRYMLLRSGHLVGVAGQVENAHSTEDWRQARVALAAVICSGSNQQIKGSATAQSTESGGVVCASPFIREADGPEVDSQHRDARNAALRRAFWSDPTVVWDPALGEQLDVFLTCKADCSQERFQATRQAVINAKQRAEKNVAAARSFIANLPSVGFLPHVARDEGWDVWELGRSLLGWLLTAIMISFGAPFWFDLIGTLVNMRVAGEKPAQAS